MPGRKSGGTIADVAGVRVGHAESSDRRTGSTAILFADAAPCVVDVRGGASCTYDTASLSLESTFGRRWGLFFSGGSVFGLDAARGVRERIVESGGGRPVFAHPTRIAQVSGATLFDLPSDDRPLPDYRALGYAAARSASSRPVLEGGVGAGVGARIGKYLGLQRSSPGGVGSSSMSLPGLGTVGALVVLNSVGAVRDPANGAWVAGAISRNGRVLPPSDLGRLRRAAGGTARGTSLVLAATEADLGADRRWLQRIATYAHAALARVVEPSHTATDGDVVFVVNSRKRVRASDSPRRVTSVDRVGHAIGRTVVAACLSAVRAAKADSSSG